jgi:hypothetical protein
MIVVSISLASAPAVDAGGAARQVLSIRTTVEGNVDPARGTISGRFTLDLGASTDTGSLTRAYVYDTLRRTRDGQSYQPGWRTESLRGRYGTLVLRVTGRQFPVGVRHARDPDGDSAVWTGTWSIVRASGRYASLRGGGGVAGTIGIAGRGAELVFLDRYEGFVGPGR